ncbi:hypothetical protein EDC38_2641 [Marinimicrobium koreense]|uniref:Uncharacterized protein n=1 Tax=Marinimicrobium koreense TaxID=306545 RepID=A0A3N1NQD8_9GAMM|nr:hypothetical protein EDC38_2641 [Marinimicrobium koreense]
MLAGFEQLLPVSSGRVLDIGHTPGSRYRSKKSGHKEPLPQEES